MKKEKQALIEFSAMQSIHNMTVWDCIEYAMEISIIISDQYIANALEVIPH